MGCCANIGRQNGKRNNRGKEGHRRRGESSNEDSRRGNRRSGRRVNKRRSRRIGRRRSRTRSRRRSSRRDRRSADEDSTSSSSSPPRGNVPSTTSTVNQSTTQTENSPIIRKSTSRHGRKHQTLTEQVRRPKSSAAKSEQRSSQIQRVIFGHQRQQQPVVHSVDSRPSQELVPIASQPKLGLIQVNDWIRLQKSTMTHSESQPPSVSTFSKITQNTSKRRKSRTRAPFPRRRLSKFKSSSTLNKKSGDTSTRKAVQLAMKAYNKYYASKTWNRVKVKEWLRYQRQAWKRRSGGQHKSPLLPAPKSKFAPKGTLLEKLPVHRGHPIMPADWTPPTLTPITAEMFDEEVGDEADREEKEEDKAATEEAAQDADVNGSVREDSEESEDGVEEKSKSHRRV